MGIIGGLEVSAHSNVMGCIVLDFDRLLENIYLLCNFLVPFLGMHTLFVLLSFGIALDTLTIFP